MTASKGVGRGFGGGRPRKDGTKAKPKRTRRFEPLVEAAAKGPVEVPPDVDVLIREAIAKHEEKRLDAEARNSRAAAEGALAPAADLLGVAYETLLDVMSHSPFPAPRVSAAKTIVEWAKEQQAAAAEAAGMTGKKAQATATAHAKIATGGKFSAPPPPPGAVRGPDRAQ